MVDYYRKIERSVTISADKRSTVDLQVDVWSADANITKFILKLDTADSTPIDLTDATVTTALVYDGVILQDNGQVEEVATQRISYVLNERLRGYEGIVNGGFYVTLKTGQKIDIQNVSFNMCKSLIDTDLKPAKENAYATFDTITSEVKDYANTQKGNIDGIVTDVKNTGNTAKTKIGQVLPDVQSKVSTINTELAKINENMPDLFVAYANDSTGNGFSKTDSSKLYKGYGIKNSNLPADYRWERNVDRLQVGGENLFLNADFRMKGLNSSKPSSYIPGAWMAYNNHSSYQFGKYDNLVNYLQFTSADKTYLGITQFYDKEILQPGKEFCVRFYTMCETADYNISVAISKKFSNGLFNWYFLQPYEKTIQKSSDLVEHKIAFTIPENDDGVMYSVTLINKGNSTSNGQTIKFVKPKLEEGNIPTAWSPAPEDTDSKINPINSILTTLSQENPSATLGGTWTQLGTESKFGNTIYYWKRTN